MQAKATLSLTIGEGTRDAARRGVAVEGQRDARGINGEGPRRVKIVKSLLTTLPLSSCVAEFFGDDLASYRNSSISCFIIKFIKFKPIIKFRKFELHNYGFHSMGIGRKTDIADGSDK